MIHRRIFLYWTIISVVALAHIGCGRSDRQRELEHNDHAVWFVHATDPHVFLPKAQKEVAKTGTPDEQRDKATGLMQQKMGQVALTDMLLRIGSLPEGDGPPAFLVLTGDLGVEPCSIATSGSSAKDCVQNVNQDMRNQQIAKTADLLGESPVRDIYLVAGNNDIALEAPDDVTLDYFNKFIDEVQQKIAEKKKNVQLHNLTRCYSSSGGPLGTCYADISNPPYCLIGFPSQSFKNREGGDKTVLNAPAQEAQFNKFGDLLKSAKQDGKKVLIVTHVPEMEDPYYLGENRYQAAPKDENGKDLSSPSITTWNVSQKLLDGWRDVLASDSVIGVLAGHLHDSHKEIYRRPYTSWSSDNDHRMGFQKLFLAPPLSVKNQDTSPIQARGFALMRLDAGRLEQRLYWYNSETRKFNPDMIPGIERHKRHTWRLARAIIWLWKLDEPQQALDRMAVILIAFLAAFLTIVQIWQIPAADNPLTGESKSPDSSSAAGVGTTQSSAAKSGFEPSPFASNFGKTVITGLAGLAAETVLKAFEGKPSAIDKEFYIIWFILFFFVLLILLALTRAFAEAVRTRLAIIHYPLTRQPEPPCPEEVKNAAGEVKAQKPLMRHNKFWRWLSYWFLRVVHWFSSLRVPLLTFFDTFINLIQGKNQTMTLQFSKTIVDQQRTLVRTANAVRKGLNDIIYSKMMVDGKDAKWVGEGVRVNISVLSADQTNVFYIARTPGSATRAFTKRSVAWVSVFTGMIRWYKDNYKDNAAKIVLYDNSGGIIADDEEKIYLQSHYQPRDQDYKGFVVFPVPWPHRGFGTDYVKGAIHISFRDVKQFEKLWDFQISPEERKAMAEKIVDENIQAEKDATYSQQLQRQRQQDVDNEVKSLEKKTFDPVKGKEMTYDSEERMLGDWCKEPDVRASLRMAIAALGELLRGFNEVIYKSYIEPEQPN